MIRGAEADAAADAGSHPDANPDANSDANRDATPDGADETAIARRLASEPWRFDFFAAVRWVETRHRWLPRIGAAGTPADDALRLGQSPTLSFAPATLEAAQPPDGRHPWRLSVRFFGLWGPQGALPLHLTERVHERTRRQPPDRAAEAFCDLFHHRLLCLLYRAWARAEPAISADRRLAAQGEAADDPLANWAVALDVPARSAHALQATLARSLRCRVRVRVSPPAWLPVPRADRCRLGTAGRGHALGSGALLGARTLATGHEVRVELGPLPVAAWQAWTGPLAARLRRTVRALVAPHLSVDLRLLLHPADAPAPRLLSRGAPAEPGLQPSSGGLPPTAVPRLGHGFWIGGADPLRQADGCRWLLP